MLLLLPLWMLESCAILAPGYTISPLQEASCRVSGSPLVCECHSQGTSLPNSRENLDSSRSFAAASLGLSGKSLPLPWPLPSSRVKQMGFIRTFSGPCQFWRPSMWAAPCQLSQCFLADARLPDIGTGTRPEWKVSFPGRMLSPCFGLTGFTTPPSPLPSRPRTLLPARNPGLRTASYQLCVFSVWRLPSRERTRTEVLGGGKSKRGQLSGQLQQTPDSRGHCGSSLLLPWQPAFPF